jgi:hypothetical protein
VFLDHNVLRYSTSHHKKAIYYLFFNPMLSFIACAMTKDDSLGLSADLEQPSDVVVPTRSLSSESFDEYFACFPETSRSWSLVIL